MNWKPILYELDFKIIVSFSPLNSFLISFPEPHRPRRSWSRNWADTSQRSGLRPCGAGRWGETGGWWSAAGARASAGCPWASISVRHARLVRRVNYRRLLDHRHCADRDVYGCHDDAEQRHQSLQRNFYPIKIQCVLVHSVMRAWYSFAWFVPW